MFLEKLTPAKNAKQVTLSLEFPVRWKEHTVYLYANVSDPS